jgi:predicted XRE-type DNA-binding protein
VWIDYLEKTMKEIKSVFDDIFPDDPAEAKRLKIKAALMSDLSEMVKTQELTQAKAARLMGVQRPRISDLMRGKISLFSIDSLLTMAVKAGLHVEISVRAA